MKLTMAAFAVILKFSDQIARFQEFIIQVEVFDNEVEIDIEQADRLKQIVNSLCAQENLDYANFAKKWEQSSQMRKWIQ